MKIKGFKQWLDDLGRNERCPCPPNYTAFLEMPDGTCVCVPVEDMQNMECRIRRRDDDLGESLRESLSLERPVEVCLADSVTARITTDGIQLKIGGQGKWFAVPQKEETRVWDIIASRLMA